MKSPKIGEDERIRLDLALLTPLSGKSLEAARAEYETNFEPRFSDEGRMSFSVRRRGVRAYEDSANVYRERVGEDWAWSVKRGTDARYRDEVYVRLAEDALAPGPSPIGMGEG